MDPSAAPLAGSWILPEDSEEESKEESLYRPSNPSSSLPILDDILAEVFCGNLSIDNYVLHDILNSNPASHIASPSPIHSPLAPTSPKSSPSQPCLQPLCLNLHPHHPLYRALYLTLHHQAFLPNHPDLSLSLQLPNLPHQLVRPNLQLLPPSPQHLNPHPKPYSYTAYTVTFLTHNPNPFGSSGRRIY